MQQDFLSHYWTDYGNIFLHHTISIPTEMDNVFVLGCLISFLFDDGNG